MDHRLRQEHAGTRARLEFNAKRKWGRNLGKFVPNSNATLYQNISGALKGPVFSVPAYFNGHLYYGAVGDRLRSFAFANARLVTPPTSQSSVIFGYPGATPSVSANGTADAIVWAVRNDKP